MKVRLLKLAQICKVTLIHCRHNTMQPTKRDAVKSLYRAVKTKESKRKRTAMKKRGEEPKGRHCVGGGELVRNCYELQSNAAYSRVIVPYFVCLSSSLT